MAQKYGQTHQVVYYSINSALAINRKLYNNIFSYANERLTSESRFKLMYPTLCCYVKALNDLGRSCSSKTDNFFPYGSDAHSYRTGFFPSRPALKYMVREAGNLLQSCKQAVSVLDRKEVAMEGDTRTLKEAMGIMPHHDAGECNNLYLSFLKV